jgi:hypothetical protein
MQRTSNSDQVSVLYSYKIDEEEAADDTEGFVASTGSLDFQTDEQAVTHDEKEEDDSSETGEESDAAEEEEEDLQEEQLPDETEEESTDLPEPESGSKFSSVQSLPMSAEPQSMNNLQSKKSASRIPVRSTQGSTQDLS